MDIFIKTYYKDYIWLKYCLQSIKKFAKGFRKVIIVTDAGHKIPEEYLCIPCDIHYVSLPDKFPSYVEHGVGYLWQQYIKLSWYNYTDADSILILDSDWMLTKITTPDDFKKDNKFYWFYRDWKNAGAGICWKPSTDFLLNVDSQYEAMCIAGYVLQRETTLALKNHLCLAHGTNDIWDIFVKYNMKSASEFNIFGSFIHYFDRSEYVKLYNENVVEYHNITIYTSWSWGGLTDNDKLKRESILQ